LRESKKAEIDGINGGKQDDKHYQQRIQKDSPKQYQGDEENINLRADSSDCAIDRSAPIRLLIVSMDRL
jgi:hypothetical protein